MTFQNNLEFAKKSDSEDILKRFRSHFFIPQKDGKDVCYLTGNSLGLQPKTVRQHVEKELKKWEELGVDGHFEGENSWFDYHKHLKKYVANIVGASEDEVTLMNTLTVNLHLMLISFYQPNGKRYRIITESGAFPSDNYALESQVRMRGYLPEQAIIELSPREGEYTLRTEDILAKINEVGEELALVMMGGVNYYTGQFFDLESITKAGHSAGALVGFDLAHATGNVLLSLHDWDIDFAVWCTYKYLNSSPGGVSGIYIHERHAKNAEMPRLAGWWGYEEETRFEMKKGFKAIPNADGWQLSNCQILPLAVHKASLEIFEEAGMGNLRAKSEKLTAYAIYIIKSIQQKYPDIIKIITPTNQKERGCQLSLLTNEKGKDIFDYLANNHIVADWRKPNVIRIAPVPLYNTYEDVFFFGQVLEEAIYSLSAK